MQRISLLSLLLLPTLLFAMPEEAATSTDVAPAREASDTTHHRYTFDDFFDALDLPTIFGVRLTPGNSVEKFGIVNTIRLGWRQHPSMGGMAVISYDMHQAEYDDLDMPETTIINGDAWHHDVSLMGGYRVPFVKDIAAFRRNPYRARANWYIMAGPGVNILELRDAETLDNGKHKMKVVDGGVVPIMRFVTGFEVLLFPKLGIFAETSYTQHLMLTKLEKAAGMERPTGPVSVNVGLSIFF